MPPPAISLYPRSKYYIYNVDSEFETAIKNEDGVKEGRCTQDLTITPVEINWLPLLVHLGETCNIIESRFQKRNGQKERF